MGLERPAVATNRPLSAGLSHHHAHWTPWNHRPRHGASARLLIPCWSHRMFLLCDYPKVEPPRGSHWDKVQIINLISKTMLISWYKLPWNSPWIHDYKTTLLVRTFHILTDAQVWAGSSLTSARHLWPVPGPQELTLSPATPPTPNHSPDSSQWVFKN